jgi:hypothetical protein
MAVSEGVRWSTARAAIVRNSWAERAALADREKALGDSLIQVMLIKTLLIRLILLRMSMCLVSPMRLYQDYLSLEVLHFPTGVFSYSDLFKPTFSRGENSVTRFNMQNITGCKTRLNNNTLEPSALLEVFRALEEYNKIMDLFIL